MYVTEDEQSLIPRVHEKIQQNFLHQYSDDNIIKELRDEAKANNDRKISYSDLLKVRNLLRIFN